MELDILEVT